MYLLAIGGTIIGVIVVGCLIVWLTKMIEITEKDEDSPVLPPN